MIVFDLICDRWHRFEGWFDSADAFDQQKQKRFLSCPVCNSQIVKKIPSATKLATKSNRHEEASSAKEKDSSDASVTVPDIVPQRQSSLGELRRAIELLIEKTEDVGSRFTEEVRKIYANEAPARMIRGTATHSEAQDLRDEGIEILVLPTMVPRNDMH